MLSKFFIDRPIFATVLSVAIMLTGFISAWWFLPVAQYPRITPPSVNVSINYPGASAQTVADTVAAPIEQQVTGVPGMLYMSSQMGNDGSYSLSITFDVNVDLNTALVMVQNRVALAMPILPTPVQNQGITIRKKTPDMLLMVNFLSAMDFTTSDGKSLRGFIKGDDGKTFTIADYHGKRHRIAKADVASISPPLWNDVDLSNFALISIKDELLRVEGVSDINIMGERDYSIRVWLDPQKLASRNMTAIDVANAVRDQNQPAAAGQVGQPPILRGQSLQLPITTLGRLNEPSQFENIIVKAAPNQPPTSLSGMMSISPGSGSGTDTTTGPATPMSTIQTPNSTGGANAAGGGTTGGGSTAGGGATTSTTDSTTSIAGSAFSVAAALKSRTPTVNSAKLKSTAKPAVNPMLVRSPPSTSISIVRLKDVARVERGALNYNISCTFDGKPSVGLSSYQLPGTNALDVADAIRAKMKELKKRFPEGVDYVIAYDTTPFIRESIFEVFHTLRDAVILVAIVVLFFLQDWRAMILPMIDVPVSLIGTFAVMAVMGYSLNNISLFGLVLAIGIVVDDAIVVLENIERQMAKGYDTRTATIKAMEEISGPILAITLVLCAVFVPCAFISGITGRFFKQFAVTIAASTVISAINALTMTPSRALMIFKAKEGHGQHEREALPWWIFGAFGFVTLWLIPRVLMAAASDDMPDDEEGAAIDWRALAVTMSMYFTPGMLIGLAVGWFVIKPVNRFLGWVFRGFNRGFDYLTDAYGWTVGMSLKVSAIVILAYGGLLVLTYTNFRDAPRGFVPQQDMGRLIVSLQLPDSASLDRTQEISARVEEIIRADPGVAHSIGLAGISFVEQANGSNFASYFIILKPFAQRQQNRLRADAIQARLRKQFAANVKDARIVVAGSSPIPGVSVAGGFRLMLQDRGGLGLTTLQEQSEGFVRTLKQQVGEDAGKKKKADDDADAPPPKKMLTGLNTQFRSNTPQLFMEIDRAKVASLGVSFDDVNQTVSIFLGSLYVNSYNDFGRYWQVTLQADREFRSKVEDINLLQVRNYKGQMVPLGTLVKLREDSGPVFVKRYNLFVAAPITGSPLPGNSSGDVIEAVDKIADTNLPRSMNAEWTELMFMQIREGSTSVIVFALAVVCVFLALSALYESWTLPLAVILVVPLCMLCSLTGVLLRRGLFGQDAAVDIFVQIGLVVLVGLACKNAILVVEFAKELHLTGGRSVYEATLESARLRLRPILMTSFAFILGVLPLCVASGAGSEMRRSLGVAVFSGMVGVTAFGIFLTPVFFYVIQGLGETRIFAGAIVQWAVSLALGVLLGAGSGYLLSMLSIVPPVWGVILGACAGVLAVLAVRGIHKKMTGAGP
jgi:multidrug efflux pump